MLAAITRRRRRRRQSVEIENENTKLYKFPQFPSQPLILIMIIRIIKFLWCRGLFMVPSSLVRPLFCNFQGSMGASPSSNGQGEPSWAKLLNVAREELLLISEPHDCSTTALMTTGALSHDLSKGTAHEESVAITSKLAFHPPTFTAPKCNDCWRYHFTPNPIQILFFSAQRLNPDAKNAIKVLVFAATKKNPINVTNCMSNKKI